ncbi:MAG: hypothetical protein A2X85_14325 [Geobacteraceae bacterium GWF2_54_21]|nr:MAG: hypothetical protein A2X85_14325 [Geobacteraceae bacterium GWF2_54_21]
MLTVIVFLILVLIASVLFVRRQLHLWVFAWLWQRVLSLFNVNRPQDRHIVIAICDHFDFGSAGEYRQGEEKKLDIWERKYPPLSDRHLDSNGVKLKHTWFFPPHYHRGDYLERLVGLCRRGYGEIEFHLHHDHIPPWPDTSETLREKIRQCIKSFSKHGVFCLPDGTKTFAFIHGDWALDNSRGGNHCGVNDEIKILAEEGCYADFTFPSLHESQPRKINSIYYVEDNPEKPKSYDTGIDVRVGGKQTGDLMLIQGPLGIGRKKKFGLSIFPSIEAASLDGANIPHIKRVQMWLKANVHVTGKPEWIFIKLHTHGAMEKNFDNNMGDMADQFFTELENEYNNPKDGYLHYVTAREMYNIIKAAEAGEKGNPGVYRDYQIPRYCYLP